MPLIRITLHEGKSPSYLRTLGDGIHSALVQTWGIPEDDRFHIIDEKKRGYFDINRTIWGVHRSDDVVVIEIRTSPRTREKKLAFFHLLPTLLEQSIGLSPEDLFINIVISEREDWSFGHGIAQLLATP